MVRADCASRTCIRSIPFEDRNHDAVMRICGEAPRRRAHSKPRREGHSSYRVAVTSVHYLQLSIHMTLGCSISVDLCRGAKEQTCRRFAGRHEPPQRHEKLAS
jgi:hypothetical protein